MADERPVQHTPKHLEGDADVFDPRHPAASAFAVAQPGAGVVADDAAERGQNAGGGTKASDAAKEYSDQKEVLAQKHKDDLRAKSGVDTAVGSVKVEGDKAKSADEGKDSTRTSTSKATETADAPPGGSRTISKK